MVTSSSSAPLTDALRAWLGSWCGQLDRWGRRVCVQHELCPGHHGSALWQLVHSDSDSVCVCTSFRSAQLSPERIAAADKFQVVTWNTFLVQLFFFFPAPFWFFLWRGGENVWCYCYEAPATHPIISIKSSSLTGRSTGETLCVRCLLFVRVHNDPAMGSDVFNN